MEQAEEQKEEESKAVEGEVPATEAAINDKANAQAQDFQEPREESKE